MTLAGLLGVLAWIGLWHTSRSFTPGGDSSETVGTRVGSDERSHVALLLLGTAASLSTAVSDVIVDAIVAEKSNADPTLARRLINRRINGMRKICKKQLCKSSPPEIEIIVRVRLCERTG